MTIKLPMPIINPAFTMRTNWAVSKSEGMCLEIGCNFGRMTTLLAINHELISGDINPKLVKMVKTKIRAYKQTVDFVVLDANNLPFQDKCFDTVLMIDVLEHLSSPISALKQAQRVGRKKILIDVPNYDFSNVLYPNLIPVHFNEATHLQRTTLNVLKSWLTNITFVKVNISGSYVPMPLLLIPISYLLESISKIVHIKPGKTHFQISCEVLLQKC
jgi:ubiquinone/menaquinone biosynthesis C-methylase UbiE